MNPFNLLINYVIASSRASFYNITGNQEVTNTALIAGMVSDNPMVSYLLIENKAKAVSETTIPIVEVLPETATNGGLSTTEDPKAQATNQSSDVVTIAEITTQINAVKATISGEIEGLKTQLATKKDLEALAVKLDSFEKDKVKLNDAITKIEARLSEISKGNQASDATSKSVANTKSQSKS